MSARWWNLTLREAHCYYDRWKTASPLERVQIDPKLPDELLDGRYQRTEQRGVSLLLRSIPSDQQQALITARELTSTALLFRLLVRYQPGGSAEKAILLSKLTVMDKNNGVVELSAALRSWRRHFRRAQEIDAALPDGTLLLKALEPACAQVAALDTQASFRLAQSRLQLGVDQHPQVRAMVRTAALKDWAIAATDIRVAFLNAPRREDGKLVAKEIPAVYKRLGLAKEGEVWLVKLAMYGLTTSPRDWSKHRDATLPQVSWVRMRGKKKVRGHFRKTEDENLWRLEEEDLKSGERHWTGLMSVYVDDILLGGEEETLKAGLLSLQATWATSSVEWASVHDAVHFWQWPTPLSTEV